MDKVGTRHNFKALFDTGAQESLIHTDIVQRLELPMSGETVEVLQSDGSKHFTGRFITVLQINQLNKGFPLKVGTHQRNNIDVFLGMDIISQLDISIKNGLVIIN